MRAVLSVEAGECTPSALDLHPGSPVTLGRNKDNSIVIRDDLASRLHAKVYFQDGKWFVRDFGLNGTRVNDLRVTGAVPLVEGSVIQIGECRLKFSAVAAMPTPMNTGTDGVRRMKLDPSAVVRSPAPAAPPAVPMPLTRKPGADAFAATRAVAVQERTAEMPSLPAAIVEPADPLKVDELTALCRFMSTAVDAADPHDVTRLALQAILNQTTAKLGGYLGLDPGDPTPKLVVPSQATVDAQLSRRLTERVRREAKVVWLSADQAGPENPLEGPPTDSLSMYTDAVCVPLVDGGGQPFAALHVYRTGLCFAEREVRFIEALAGYLAKALEIHRHRRKLRAENDRLRSSAPVAEDLIGDSNALTTLRHLIGRASPQPFTVLIEGETGSGKELVALALHGHSLRKDGPMVVVNCAAIAPTLLEAELFGYRKGAFSGADRDYAGLFERADEGTLFLDEVGELSLECQAKLLRVVEGKSFRPVGGAADVKVDVRVIAATHRDLEKEAKAGRFRQDLYFRLKVINLKVPPLRDHLDDVPELARFFLERLSVQCHRAFRLTPAALKAIQHFSWPGNVRQLRAVLESAAVMGESDLIDAVDLPLGNPVETATTDELPPGLDVDELETWAVRKALRQTNGNVSQAAKLLGMSRDTLHTKIKKKNIDKVELCATTVDE
ncbi:MAG TPA: sigma 54-interacting transcriptional regulator [Fimbriiglobus sp.]|jgi:Nif-specific regulatory protein